MKRSLLSLTISLCSNVDEFVDQIKEIKLLRRIYIYKRRNEYNWFDSDEEMKELTLLPRIYRNKLSETFNMFNNDDENEATIDEMCNRILKLDQHPYLSLFVGNDLTKHKHVMRPDEKYIVASDEQWEETFSKEKKRGTLYFRQCPSCEEE